MRSRYPEHLVHLGYCRFISNARKHGKVVLIFSTDGQNEAQAFIIQHLMLVHRLSTVKTIAFLEKLGVQIRLVDNFVAALNTWERQLAEEARNEVSLSQSQMSQNDP